MTMIGKFLLHATGLVTLFVALSPAQDSTYTGWKKSLIIDVTTTQTAYSDSWTGGEAGAVNWVGNLNGAAERHLSPWFHLRSTLKLSFGQTITQSPDKDNKSKSWSKPKKSTDLIDFENVGRFTAKKFIDPYVAFRFESQFLDASFEPKNRFLTPIKLTESAGIIRRFYERDNDLITSRLGLAIRQMLKNVIIDSVALITEDSTLADGGLESVTDVSYRFNERLQYTGKLTLFKAFFFSGKDEVKGTKFEDDWRAVDINWENIVAASISRVVTVNFYTQLLYDKQVSKRGRFKETLAIGFVFKMF
ncbi:MAG: DUF3078 domain-containing protein [Candidatus Zixiibacteriota bacterium]|nr:MAG: DUF3078 domain-containing protein [candidate division Zixibacteria bacterium]